MFHTLTRGVLVTLPAHCSHAIKKTKGLKWEYQTTTANITSASTLNAVSSSLNPAQPTSNVTFTATLTVVSPGAGTPTGNVTFKDSGTSLGTGALNGADVDEHVVAAVIRLNEAKALGRVKPLHGSHAHGGSPFSR